MAKTPTNPGRAGGLKNRYGITTARDSCSEVTTQSIACISLCLGACSSKCESKCSSNCGSRCASKCESQCSSKCFGLCGGGGAAGANVISSVEDIIL